MQLRLRSRNLTNDQNILTKVLRKFLDTSEIFRQLKFILFHMLHVTCNLEVEKMFKAFVYFFEKKFLFKLKQQKAKPIFYIILLEKMIENLQLEFS